MNVFHVYLVGSAKVLLRPPPPKSGRREHNANTRARPWSLEGRNKGGGERNARKTMEVSRVHQPRHAMSHKINNEIKSGVVRFTLYFYHLSFEMLRFGAVPKIQREPGIHNFRASANHAE